jgi:uncharacterized protein
MPVQVSYPGVYIEEIPAAPAAIGGAPASVTAFVGPTALGPLNTPTQVNSFGDFSRNFGGLSRQSPLSYAVQQFFQNGGATALIVRVAPTDSTTASMSLAPEGGVVTTLQVNQAGAAGNAMRLSIAPVDLTAARYALTLSPGGGALPVLYQVSMKDPAASDYITTVLTASTLIQVSGTVSKTLALLQSAAFSGGTDASGSASRATATVSGLTLATLSASAACNKWTLQVGPPAVAKDNYFSLAIQDAKKNPQFPAIDVSISSGDGADFVTNALANAKNYTGQAALFTATQVPTTAPSSAATGNFAGGTSGTPATSAQLAIPDVSTPITFQACSPGAWGNALSVTVDYKTNPINATLFNLTVQLATPLGAAKIETFPNVSTQSSDSNFVGTVLASNSTLLALTGSASLSARPLAADPATLADGNGVDGVNFDGVLPGGAGQGFYALDAVHTFNLLCIPPLSSGVDITSDIYAAALAYCVNRRALLIVDPPGDWTDASSAVSKSYQIDYLRSPNAAVFFPYIFASDPLQNNRTVAFAPCGFVAGVMARTDAARGVWKSAAGVQATLLGAQSLSVNLTDAEQGELNPLGINTARWFAQTGPILYGARTLAGADALQSPYKYIAVRRMALYIEDSLYDGLQFAVFEPNAEPLWAQIRLSVGAFLQQLFEQDAFAGRTPAQAYLVKCDADNNPPAAVSQGVVNVLVGFAPLEPAEFVIVQLLLMNNT